MKTRYFEKTLKQVNGRCKAPVAHALQLLYRLVSLDNK